MRSGSSLRAVSINTATVAVLVSSRNLARTSNPDIPGSIRSSTTSEGRSRRAIASASGPVLAEDTLYPTFAK
jgi:hypothetical protein